nr:MAG TPA: hypothetical protein [Caudoviricetes sp.]
MLVSNALYALYLWAPDLPYIVPKLTLYRPQVYPNSPQAYPIPSPSLPYVIKKRS